MPIESIKLDGTEKNIINHLRQLPAAAKKKIAKQIEELLEKMEDLQDLKDARARMKEKSTPASEVYKKLGLE